MNSKELIDQLLITNGKVIFVPTTLAIDYLRDCMESGLKVHFEVEIYKDKTKIKKLD